MRYTALLGFNTKQFWIYDEEKDVFINPPSDVLKFIREVYDDTEEAQVFLEKLVNEGQPSWLHDGNEIPADEIDI